MKVSETKERRGSNKMKQKLMVVFVCLTILFSMFAVNVYAGPTLTANATGTFEGYDYEYWKDNGTGTMTLNGGGSFSCSWSNINNILFRTGKKLGSTKTYQEYGNIEMNYACNYQPNGNSYMSVYGWTKEPLVEYYIIDSYGTWKPPGNQYQPKGTISVDGGTYEIYETTRTQQPSIIGTATFQQYWSIRTVKRTSGKITVSDHFKAWEAKGMKMGKLYEVSMVVEGYQSSGKAEMTKMDITMGPQTSTPPQSTIPPQNTIPSGSGKVGDVNGDNSVNSTDCAALRRHILNVTPLTGKNLANADTNLDGSVNSTDYTMLKRAVLGLITLPGGGTQSPIISYNPSPTPTPKPSAQPSAKFHCFLLLGQSNMSGYPKAQESDKVKNPRILELNYTSNQWEVAVPPLHETYQDAIGPGDWFAKTIINELPEGDTIGLIPCAENGMGIDHFLNNKYSWIVNRCKLAQQRGGVIEGILFCQGETDTGNPSWPGKVNTLVSNLKRDLGLGDVPFLAGELLYSGTSSSHNQLIRQLPNTIKNCHVISAQGLVEDTNDQTYNLHFDHNSQVEFGKRYAKKMTEVLGW